MIFVFVRYVRHRWMFLSPEALESEAGHSFAQVLSQGPRQGRAEGLVLRTIFLLLSLAGVVGLAKTLAPQIESAVGWLGAPQGFVGVLIALLVFLPESLTAFQAASRGEMQTILTCRWARLWPVSG